MSTGDRFKPTRRQIEVLCKIRDGIELVYSCGIGYLGAERVGAKTVLALMRMMAIKGEQGNKPIELERFTISETGRKVLADIAKLCDVCASGKRMPTRFHGLDCPHRRLQEEQ